MSDLRRTSGYRHRALYKYRRWGIEVAVTEESK